MISKKEKTKRRILDSLNKAELSTDKGGYEKSQFTKPNKKVRRHSGRYTPQLPEKRKFSDMIADAEEPAEEYDDWINYRDGFRDFTKLGKPQLREEAIKRNLKIKKRLAIRKAMKEKNG